MPKFESVPHRIHQDTTYVVEERPCEHAMMLEHPQWVSDGETSGYTSFCPGGSRIVLEVVEPDYEAARKKLERVVSKQFARVYDHELKRIIDAALAGARIVREAGE